MKASLIFLLLCCFLSNIHSQGLTPSDHNDKELYWFSFGVGSFGPGYGFLGKATYAWGVSSISAKISHSEILETTSDLPYKYSTPGEVSEYGLYFGRQALFQNAIARIAVGVAYFNGRRNYDQFFHELGVGAEVEGILMISPVGLGIMGSAMISPKFVYVGISLNAHLGKMF